MLIFRSKCTFDTDSSDSLKKHFHWSLHDLSTQSLNLLVPYLLIFARSIFMRIYIRLCKNFRIVQVFFCSWQICICEKYHAKLIRAMIRFTAINSDWVVQVHWMKSVLIRSYSGPYSVQMLENTDSFYAVVSIFIPPKVYFSTKKLV